MDLRPLLICLTIAASVFGQHDFEIDGEQTYTLKSPFALSVPGQYSLFDWGASDEVKLSDGGLFSPKTTVSAPVGSHSVHCSAVHVSFVDGEVKFELDKFELQFDVSGSVEPPKDPPPPPKDPPDDNPSVDYKRLEAISRSAVGTLNDMETAAALEKALSVARDLFTPERDLSQMKFLMTSAITNAFLSVRTTKEWHGNWRVPINGWMQANIKTKQQFAKAVDALIASFDGASKALSSLRTKTVSPVIIRESEPKKIVMYRTRDYCRFCDLWDKNHRSFFEAAGFDVEDKYVSAGLVPRYDIHYRGRLHRHTEYLDTQTADKLLGGTAWRNQ